MKGAKFNKNLTVTLEEETHRKIKDMTSERGISMMDWLRELIDEELGSFSVNTETTIFEDLEANQREEDERNSGESHSKNSEELDLEKLVLGDDDTTGKVDEIE